MSESAESSSPAFPDQSRTIETALAAWDDRLAALERQASSLLRATRRLRKAAQEGAVAGFAAGVTAVQQDAAKLQEALEQTTEAPAIDVAAAFANGGFLRELTDAAAASNVTVVQRDGRITAYPVVLHLEARSQAVRIGRKLERRIRPSFLARELKALQQRPNRFNARALLDRLARAYAILAPDWRTGEGPLVALADLHDLLTLLPAAAADYPLEEFLCDLLRLDREPDARSSRGFRFELGGSTGTKGAKRLSAFDESGAQHDYFAIRFMTD
jgi:hypothetical protein